jgi:hypothetical protein
MPVDHLGTLNSKATDVGFLQVPLRRMVNVIGIVGKRRFTRWQNQRSRA